jgi:hypothetical protein
MKDYLLLHVLLHVFGKEECKYFSVQMKVEFWFTVTWSWQKHNLYFHCGSWNIWLIHESGTSEFTKETDKIQHDYLHVCHCRKYFVLFMIYLSTLPEYYYCVIPLLFNFFKLQVVQSQQGLIYYYIFNLSSYKIQQNWLSTSTSHGYHQHEECNRENVLHVPYALLNCVHNFYSFNLNSY